MAGTGSSGIYASAGFTLIHYPTPVHLTEAFERRHHGGDRFPAAEQCAGEILSLPMYPELEREQVQYVAEQIRNFVTR